MYESITYESILQRMLDKMPNTLDKREGSVIYDALAPAAVELQLMYIELDVILNESFGDTASRTYLIKRAAERGLTPNDATYAILKGVFNKAVNIGARFSLGTLNYAVTEVVDNTTHSYKLKCETAGVIGNSQFGKLVPIDYIDGLTSAQLTELLIPGEDEEATETFRARYLASFDSQAYGGNIADYKEKVNAISGVGGVKVYPVWAGGGTVKLVIINSEYEVPSAEMIKTVQTTIDPVTNSGEGDGVAPIGHKVTVVGATAQSINIGLTLTFSGTYTFADLKASIESLIDAYFLEINKTWDDNMVSIIRVSQIETRILTLSGIVDVQNTTLNGVAGNLTLDANSIAVRGTISG